MKWRIRDVCIMAAARQTSSDILAEERHSARNRRLAHCASQHMTSRALTQRHIAARHHELCNSAAGRRGCAHTLAASRTAHSIAPLLSATVLCYARHFTIVINA